MPCKNQPFYFDGRNILDAATTPLDLYTKESVRKQVGYEDTSESAL
jgi:hypothetical protein